MEGIFDNCKIVVLPDGKAYLFNYPKEYEEMGFLYGLEAERNFTNWETLPKECGVYDCIIEFKTKPRLDGDATNIGVYARDINRLYLGTYRQQRIDHFAKQRP